MKLLTEPKHNAATNSTMDAAQICTAAKFVDELISLGTLLGPFPTGHTKAFGPMFSLEKPGQPGEWLKPAARTNRLGRTLSF
jgi:hypothetical protein